jgi:hypothetical protein
MKRELWVVDLEGNSLHPTTIWCLSSQAVGEKSIQTVTNYEDMKKLLVREDVVIIGHNFIRFDAVVLERLLGIKIKAKIIDTLAIAWVLDEKRHRVGLESYGEDAGIPKVVVEEEQWSGTGMSKKAHAKLMKERCEDDVRINMWLWNKQWAELMELYEGDEDAIWRYLAYLMFKMDCAREQERSAWKLDEVRCTEALATLEAIKDQKVEELGGVMPQVKKYKVQSYPAKPFLISGAPSATGLRWNALCEAHGKPEGYRGDITFLHHEVDPNPGSSVQIKAWLFDLGWKPRNFKFVRNKETNETREIPQVKSAFTDEGEVCDSVKLLFAQVGELEVLNGLGILSHRIGVLKGFLKNVDEDGYIRAEVQGFTNTLRFKHTVIANLPGVDKMYGEIMRGVLIAPEGMELCGADMAALEDRTKQHYMLPHDPAYVAKMMAPGYCPHIDIAELAGYLTPEEGERYRTGKFLSKEDEKHIKAQRKAAKPVNYGGVYGQSAAGLAQSAGMPIKQAEALNKIYWERNWSVKAIAKEQVWKHCLDGMWLRNPVSGFWYSLRNEKDIFSTLNQGTGVYCFDIWVRHIRKKRPQLTAQFHDEVVLCIKKGHREGCTKLLKGAIIDANKELGLNRELDISVDYGDSYAEIH